MVQTESDEKRSSANEIHPQSYSASWVNCLTAWVDRRPWPSWSFYLGLWAILVIILVATLWIEGVRPVGTVFPAQLFIPAMITLLLAMIHYLDRRAAAALTTLKPALKATEAQCHQLQSQLTTMPAWPTILASVVTVGAIALLGVLSGERESSIEALAASPIAANLLFAVYWIGWWVFGAFAYHTSHQLRVINRIYTSQTRVHLFAMSPLYAFSGVTALTAATLATATYGWTALNPDNLSDPVSLAMIFLISLLALVVFAWPLLGTRRLLSKEKARWLDQISLRVEAVFAEIHKRIDAGETKEVEELAKVIAVLEKERDALRGISTWPWQPETLRFLVTALLVPLLIWIIQYVVQLALGS